MTNNILTYTLNADGSPISVNAIGEENLVETATTLAGTTGGSLIYSMPFSGVNFKLFVLFFDNYENDTTTAQVITFPIAFSIINEVIINTSGITPTTNLTTISINPDTTTIYNGTILLIGI